MSNKFIIIIGICLGMRYCHSNVTIQVSDFIQNDGIDNSIKHKKLINI